jgi:hypothetical protein
VSNAKLHYDLPNHHLLVFCDEHIIFLLVALHGGGSWWTAVRQIINVPVSVFEMFHPVLQTAGNHAGISTNITQLIKDVCGRTVVLHDEFSHTMLVKQQIHHLQKFCHSGLWIKSSVHVMHLYFKLQQTDIAIGHITLSQIALIKHA